MPPAGLIDWMIKWCSRPGMYLAGPRDRGRPDISNLWMLVNGFLCAESPRGEASAEWNSLMSWMAAHHEGYFRDGVWFGEVILSEADGDHEKAAGALRDLLEEFRRQQS